METFSANVLANVAANLVARLLEAAASRPRPCRSCPSPARGSPPWGWRTGSPPWSRLWPRPARWANCC